MSSTISFLRFTPLLPPKTLTPKTLISKTLIPKRNRILTTTRSSLTPIPAADRLIAATTYVLPFLNALPYSRFLLPKQPLLSVAISPFLPLLSLLHSLPFASFVLFFSLYLGIVRNPSLSRFVRFNAMQAVVLDVLLALPSLVQRVFGTPVRGVGFKVLEFGYGVVFAFGAVCFVYSVGCCVLGRTPYLPLVATAADRQL